VGQVKNLFIKNLARELVEKYPDKFSEDFQKNKEELEKLIKLESKKIRNLLAGYIVHILRKRKLSG